ncbi:MAG: hypothetical protein A3E01_16295 [Gammaproteobacteria bacterium RIFCSPHIGHO2_12_FULL_63_22]|nr:MAG: hypothetical protein A3E01_16295 [Gammaproteobacteria bacterium RIFCSPHIGHO2_12_FULL_63_22]
MTSIISREVARVLLTKLATEPKFRERFDHSVRGALQSIGHETPDADRGIPGRDPVLPLENLRGGLASPEKIAEQTEAMLATYDEYERTGDASVLIFHQFDICAE